MGDQSRGGFLGDCCLTVLEREVRETQLMNISNDEARRIAANIAKLPALLESAKLTTSV